MDENNTLEDTLEGVCTFHTETGTEGGYWAFQDNQLITQTSPSFVFANQTVFDSNNPERRGKIHKAEVLLEDEWLPLPDPITEDPDFYISSLFCGERDGDREADQRIMKRYNFTIKYAAERMDERHGKGNWHLEDSLTAVTSDGTRWMYGGTPSAEPQRPYPQNGPTRVTVKWDDDKVELKRLSNTLLVESWSYKGLHLLKNDDYLEIYNPDNQDEIIWSGKINLKQHPLFTEHASGYWIHADQIGIEREVWTEYFFKNYPAKLLLAPDKKPE